MFAAQKVTFLLVFLFIGLVSCVPESKKILTEVDINPRDPIFQKITNFQIEQQLDSIVSFLNHENPTYRYLAVKSFASLEAPEMVPQLATLLDDPVIKVRSMAAFALGQQGESSAEEYLLKGFRQRDTMSVDNQANGAILEALGKIGKKSLADYMCSAEGYRDQDTLLLLGRMKALYNFSLRGITTPSMTELAVNTVRDEGLDKMIRLYAAHYLARAKNLDIEKLKFQIAEAFIDEPDVEVKMALTTALRHTNDEEIQKTLLDQLELEQDYRVKCNIIRTLKNYNYINAAQKVSNLLKHENIHIARAAVDYLKYNGTKEDASFYRKIARDSLPWQVKTELYDAVNYLLPYYYSKTINATRWQIQQIVGKETDTLVLSHYIKALGHDPGAYPEIIKFIKEKPNPLLVAAGTEALKTILADENFNGTFQTYSRFHRRQILEYFKALLLEDNEAAIGEVGLAIADATTGLAELIDSTEFLFEAKAKLSNPGQIESIHALDKAIATIRGVRRPNLTPLEGSPVIDWELLQNAGNNTQAIIKTDKGVFTVALFVEDAPQTVLNFLKLVEENYYDDKVFHRVVPNFVVQTGSPYMNNYGGKDYVINTEISEYNYESGGYLGMASAGRHTESSQFFVTHSATPHLNGGYTIFGKVIDGMSVVHDIQLGDKIIDIIISNI